VGGLSVLPPPSEKRITASDGRVKITAFDRPRAAAFGSKLPA